MEIVHTPVLLDETLALLAPEKEGAFMIDCTLGEGGHSEAFLKAFPTLCILGLDADSSIQARAKERLCDFSSQKRMKFWNGWSNDFFEHYSELSEETGGKKADLILFDLGISVFHYEKSGRGFSFRGNEKLDMRLSPLSKKSAAEIVNTLSEEKLADLIFHFSDEKKSRKIAHAICVARADAKIETASALAQIIKDAIPHDAKIHPATRTFQALRIAVNDELSRLPKMLVWAFKNLSIGGKMGVITFHSIEDRIVKNCFRLLSRACVCPPEIPVCNCGGTECAVLLTKKPIEPTESEVKKNSPSRSAKLRTIKKKSELSDEKIKYIFSALGSVSF